MEPNGNTELSPISPSDDDGEAGVGGSNRIGDEVAADDDPESKRRWPKFTFDLKQSMKGVLVSYC